MEKKITVKELIEKYNKNKQDDAQIEKHILSVYVPYEEKCAMCQGVIDATTKVNIGNDTILKQDSAAMVMLYRMQMINKYTDIQIDFSHVLTDYNLLDRYDLIDNIIAYIKTSERKKMDEILSMKIKDYHENYRSFFSLWNSIVDKFKIVGHNFADKLNDIVDEQTLTDLRKTLSMHITKK